jgi:hypothetical protein
MEKLMEVAVDSLKIQAVTIQILGNIFGKDQSLTIKTPEPNTSKTLLCRYTLVEKKIKICSKNYKSDGKI